MGSKKSIAINGSGGRLRENLDQRQEQPCNAVESYER